jgi:hypothetical protein
MWFVQVDESAWLDLLGAMPEFSLASNLLAGKMALKDRHAACLAVAATHLKRARVL